MLNFIRSIGVSIKNAFFYVIDFFRETDAVHSTVFNSAGMKAFEAVTSAHREAVVRAGETSTDADKTASQEKIQELHINLAAAITRVLEENAFDAVEMMRISKWSQWTDCTPVANIEGFKAMNSAIAENLAKAYNKPLRKYYTYGTIYYAARFVNCTELDDITIEHTAAIINHIQSNRK